MRAVVMRGFGDPDVLAIEDVPVPSPRAEEALIRVAAVEVSRTRDVAARSGRHPFSRQLRAAAVTAGSEVLITGVTGALATVLVVLASRFGARVTGLSRRVAAVAASLPVTVLDSGREDLTQAIRDAAKGYGPDSVIDNVAAPEVFDRYFPALKNGARIVISGAIGPPDLPVLQVPAVPLYIRSICLLGVRTATAGTTLDFWDLVRDGFRLPPGLVHVEALEAASAVHDAVIKGTTVGHTVLRVSDSVA